jgi:hypothetical protein
MTTYNGWTNYATWRVNLEILDDYVSSLVGTGPVWDDVAHCTVTLRDYVDETMSDTGAESFVLDYARAFVSDVDFHEIAQAIHDSDPELFVGAEDEDAADKLATNIDRIRDEQKEWH